MIRISNETAIESERRDLKAVIAADPAFTEIAQYLTWAKDLGLDPGTSEVMSRALAAGRAAWELANRNAPIEDLIADVEQRPGLTHRELVYYIRMGSLVKIGTTINLRERLDTLMAQGVLAVEVGGRKHERLRHAQFGHARSYREWFHPTRDLVDHIFALRSSLERAVGEPLDDWMDRELLDRKRWQRPSAIGQPLKPTANERATYASRGLVTASDAALLAGVTVASINSWRHRGRLQPVKYENAGINLYKLSDVLAAGRRRRSGRGGSMSTPNRRVFGVRELRNLLTAP